MPPAPEGMVSPWSAALVAGRSGKRRRGQLDLRWQRVDTRNQRLSEQPAAAMKLRQATFYGPRVLFSLSQRPRLRYQFAEGWLPVTDLEQSAEPVIVRVPAEIDTANAQDVGERLRSAFTRGAAVVIADLTSTVFCDLAGARQFVLSHNYADFHGARMRFVIPDRNLLRVLTLTGLDQLLSVYPSLDAAVSAGSALDGDAASG